MNRNRYWRTGLIGLAVAAWLITACQPDPKPGLSGDKDMQELIEMVLNKRPKASTLAKGIGPEANPELIKLAGHEDADVRRVAMYCLRETGGPDAAKSMAGALLDKNSQVRAAALKGLKTKPEPGAYSQVLNAFDSSDAPYTRQQIALIIGLMGQVSARADLKVRWAKLENDEVAEGVVTALAKLGDPEAQADFVKRLHASQERDRGRYLEHCRYISQPWLVEGLLPILDDETPMVRIGVDGIDNCSEYLRACDIAVNLTASITGTEFSLEDAGGANYSEQERADVKAFIESYVPAE